MNNFPKGNDLIVKWAIKYSDGTPFPLENYAWELCYSAGRGINVVKDTAVISVSDNLLTWRFSGKDQAFYGKYSLTLRLYQQGKIVATVRKNNAFELSTTQYDGPCDIDLVSYCDNISLQDALLRGNKAMEVARDADKKSTEALNKANAAIAKVEGVENATEAAYTAASSANAAAADAKTQADRAELNNQTFDSKEAQRDAAMATISQEAEILNRVSADIDVVKANDAEQERTINGLKDQVNNYKPIEIFGNVTNAADEEDITTENGLLKFKNRSSLNGMGYVILRKDKTFAEQVTEANTIYEIRYDFDLRGESVTIPENCVLKFEGGSLSNGKITTPYNLVPLSVIHYATDLQYNYYKDYEYPVYVRGLVNGEFRNIAIDGLFVTSQVSYEYFVGYKDDTSLLEAIFGLGMSGNFDCDIDLEQGRIYEITSSKADYSDSIYDFKRIANKTINGNGATIKDLRTRAFFAGGLYVSVLGFWQSNNIKIYDLNYRNDNEDWPVGVVYDLNVCGAAFIHAFLDCDNFDINISTYGARYGFVSGEYSNYWWCGENGLTNSRINVTSQLTGYPLVVQIGDGLDLWTHSEIDHRSNYLMGVRNARVYIESKDHYSAPYACLLGDFRYSGEYGKTLYRGIEKITIEFNDLGTTQIVGMSADGTSFTPDGKCVGFSLWGEGASAGRDFPLIFKDIIINIYIPEGSIIGDFAMSRNEADPKYPQTAVKDLYGNIHIKSFSNRTIAGTPTRITFASSCIYADVDFSLNNNDIELAADQICHITNNSSFPVVIKNSKSKIKVFCAGDNIEFVDCYDINIQKSSLASSTPRITEIASYVTNAADVDVISGKLTPVNTFPLNTNMNGAKRGLVVLRSSGGLLVWNNGWFSIPLYPVTITSTQRTGPMSSVGQSTQRLASPSSAQKGFPFYDTSIDKPIWQKGYEWIEADGAVAGIKRSGATAERPTPTIIGFTYFDTDLGKMIVWNGSAWVNMDGSALS